MFLVPLMKKCNALICKESLGPRLAMEFHISDKWNQAAAIIQTCQADSELLLQKAVKFTKVSLTKKKLNHSTGSYQKLAMVYHKKFIART